MKRSVRSHPLGMNLGWATPMFQNRPVNDEESAAHLGDFFSVCACLFSQMDLDAQMIPLVEQGFKSWSPVGWRPDHHTSML
jgi:hypothetical protein